MNHEHAGQALVGAGGGADWVVALAQVLDGSWYMPHGHCYLWQPALVWLNVLSDALIGAAYLFISITLYVLVRRIRLPFSTAIIAFGVFIGACGLTHLMEVWNVWHSAYWLAGGIKAVTAVASVLTGIYLVPLRARIADLVGAARLAEERRTQLESKNQELEALYSRVKEAESLKSRFFANVSHDLRTPLALLIGPLEKLLADPALPAAQRRDLEMASRNANLLLREVNDLLDTARLDAGRIAPDYADADLAELTRQTAAYFVPLAAQRGVDLQVDAPSELAAQVDVEKVQRVLLNLLSNAFKYAPENRGRVRVALRRDGERAQVEVADNGPGVPAPLREAIFERFRQGEESDPRRALGIGLGLSIARDFLALHQGTISVDEAPGGGARFVAALPLRAPSGAAVRAGASVGEAAAGALAARVAVDALGPPRAATAAGVGPEFAAAGRGGAGGPLLLLVEDNDDMRAQLAEALGGEFRVITAVDGVEALQTGRAMRPDVIVADVMMPRMSGDQLVRAARADPWLASVPILLLTARADEPLKQSMLESGAQDYLIKPARAQELRARARNLAVQKRARDVLQQELASRAGQLDELAQELALRKRQLEAALAATQAARAEAEEASMAKSTFLRLVSHELRTPLTALQLQIETLVRRGDPQASAERLMRSFKRLRELVESVLEFTRAESGRLVIARTRFDLVALARDVVDGLRPQAQQKLLALEFESAPEVPPATSDSRAVQIVLTNLIVNAIKYTTEGSIRVRVSSGPEGHRIAVQDTGPGIGPELRERMFEPFVQGEPLATKHTPGVGLGLALVRELVRALGARIEIDSEPGRGSTFTVVLAEAAPQD